MSQVMRREQVRDGDRKRRKRVSKGWGGVRKRKEFEGKEGGKGGGKERKG